ncbi:MAG: histidine--tRNA ligase [Ruminococcaceae bacterium]|nr:histidine--tRNA ligase [Oscillospiraceae bacterium]
MAIKAPRGTADILPQDAALWRFVEKTAAETARNFGYEEIRTPVFEHTELFQRGVGDTTDVVQKEMYTFNDKGDRSITLRPEGTASAARAYIEHSMHALPQPVKLYYCGACYRYEKPQAGRLREFHQFGIEAFGSTDPALDAEIIALASTIFKNLGATGLELNINSIGCPECRKKYNEALTAYLSSHSETLCETCNTRLGKNPMRVLDCKSPVCKEVAAGAPQILSYICEDCRAHFEMVQQYLHAMDIPFTIDASIVRGLDYYTRTVFEFVSTQIGAQGTVCGGGRYDGLLEELGGNPGPGMGFAMGIERIILVLRAMGLVKEEKNSPRLFVASIGQTEAALALCQKLRGYGVYAVCDVAGRSLKAQMKNADREGAKFSLVLGDEEVHSGEAQLKNMETGEKITVSLGDIPALVALI